MCDSDVAAPRWLARQRNCSNVDEAPTVNRSRSELTQGAAQPQADADADAAARAHATLAAPAALQRIARCLSLKLRTLPQIAVTSQSQHHLTQHPAAPLRGSSSSSSTRKSLCCCTRRLDELHQRRRCCCCCCHAMAPYVCVARDSWSLSHGLSKPLT